jgi:choline dehydrogenase-like flavoprotein
LKFTDRLEPSIPPNYFGDPDDMSRMVAGYEMVCRIADAEPFRSLVVKRVRPDAGRLSHDEIERFLRNSANTTYHPCGTCRMGEDDGAIVDSRLKVRGMRTLRVIDASVMSHSLSEHPSRDDHDRGKGLGYDRARSRSGDPSRARYRRRR